MVEPAVGSGGHALLPDIAHEQLHDAAVGAHPVHEVWVVDGRDVVESQRERAIYPDALDCEFFLRRAWDSAGDAPAGDGRPGKLRAGVEALEDVVVVPAVPRQLQEVGEPLLAVLVSLPQTAGNA